MSKIDNAADRVKQAVDKTADSVKGAVRATGDKVKYVGDAIKKAGK